MAKSTRSTVKTQPYSIPTPPAPDDQPSKIENIISVILGIAVVLVIGAMIVNTIRNRQGQQQSEAEKDAAGKATATQSAGTYTVEVGDTLWSIAVKTYNDGYKWPDIQKANNITDPSTIEKGTTLIIPTVATQEVATVVTSPKTDPAAQETPAAGSTGPTGGVNEGQTLSTSTDSEYTVVAGDSLWNIAVKKYNNGYRWIDIAKANNLANPDLIHPGNVFAMPK